MEIPGILDDLSEGKPCKLVIDCEGAPSDQQQESQLRAERFAVHRPRPLRHRPPPRAEACVRSSSRNSRHRSQAYPFSAEEFWGAAGKPELATQIQLKRPNFLPIVSSVLLAQASSAVLAADPDPSPAIHPSLHHTRRCLSVRAARAPPRGSRVSSSSCRRLEGTTRRHVGSGAACPPDAAKRHGDFGAADTLA